MLRGVLSVILVWGILWPGASHPGPREFMIQLSVYLEREIMVGQEIVLDSRMRSWIFFENRGWTPDHAARLAERR